MDANPFHQIGVVLLVQVIAPLQRSMLGREDGILVTLVNTVSLNRGISSFNQLLMTHPQPGQTFFVSHDQSKNSMFSLSLKAFISASFSKPFQAA